MIIIARYSGVCSRCGGGFPKGEKIEWEKGGTSGHLDCRNKRAVDFGLGIGSLGHEPEGEPIDVEAELKRHPDPNARYARRGEELVKCSCGHSVPRVQVMGASLGSSCPDCYDRLSD